MTTEAKCFAEPRDERHAYWPLVVPNICGEADEWRLISLTASVLVNSADQSFRFLRNISMAAICARFRRGAGVDTAPCR